MDYVIFDLATVRYRFTAHRTSVSALAATGELLAVVELAPHHSEREAAFLAVDAALAGGRVQRHGERYRVALYNPYTAEVCIRPVPDTLIFTDRTPLVLAPEGVTAELDANQRTIEVPAGGPGLPRVLASVTPTFASTSRAILAHQ